MKLIILIGAGAVGKMTVGQELAKITDLRLCHNHMTIEPVIEIFGQYVHSAVKRIREAVFEEFAKSDEYGMIFTYMWAFDQQSDWDYIDSLANIFRQEAGEIYYVELVAQKEIRLERNVTENRLHNKASKRNIEWSNANMLREDENYRLVSHEGEIPFENYMKIDNSDLAPNTVVEIIKEKFSL